MPLPRGRRTKSSESEPLPTTSRRRFLAPPAAVPPLRAGGGGAVRSRAGPGLKTKSSSSLSGTMISSFCAAAAATARGAGGAAAAGPVGARGCTGRKSSQSLSLSGTMTSCPGAARSGAGAAGAAAGAGRGAACAAAGTGPPLPPATACSLLQGTLKMENRRAGCAGGSFSPSDAALPAAAAASSCAASSAACAAATAAVAAACSGGMAWKVGKGSVRVAWVATCSKGRQLACPWCDGQAVQGAWSGRQAALSARALPRALCPPAPAPACAAPGGEPALPASQAWPAGAETKAQELEGGWNVTTAHDSEAALAARPPSLRPSSSAHTPFRSISALSGSAPLTSPAASPGLSRAWLVRRRSAARPSSLPPSRPSMPANHSSNASHTWHEWKWGKGGRHTFVINNNLICCTSRRERGTHSCQERRGGGM